MTRGILNSQNDQAAISLLSIKLHFPGCASLKEKRSRLLPIITRLRKEFNAGFSETGLQDVWQSAWISCAIVTNSGQLNSTVAGEIVKFIEIRFPGEMLEEHRLEQR